jgi:DNA-binding NarL/FixJ family response regulator
MSRPRILIAFAHPSWTETVDSLLRPHFDVVGRFSDGPKLLIESLRLQPDVIVTEVHTAHLHGFKVIRRLTAIGSKSRAVFVTIRAQPEIVNACMAAGATGYILKSQIAEHLIPAITAAINGETYIRV